MSQAAASQALPSPRIPLEQLIYERSPFGTAATTALLFVLLFGSFVVIAALEHVTTFAAGRGVFGFSDAGWPAFVLSLLCVTALGMQRYARLAEIRDAQDYARVLAGGMKSALSVTSLAPRGAKLPVATAIGCAMGIAIGAAVRVAEMREGHAIPPGTMLWFASATILLSLLFARGVALTRAGGRGYARLLNAELKIDLLRTDTLAVLGRSAARTSLIWFVVSAVAFLFFVGGDLNWLTIALIAGCAAMGISIFASIMSRIHRQIRHAKDLELEHIRKQIELARAALHDDSGAAARMHGLLVYEKRIADAPEWPFDQSTLVRVAAYILIPTVPWFGQAVAGYAIEHLAR